MSEKYKMALVACLTLGLAPFFPEPHIFGKVRWILGGAHGMAPIDWFDAVLHGTPWVVLIYIAVKDLATKSASGK
ncbi:MAG: hypothetical protein H6696_04215 [Deferribacteres bacterium]|nr:hypothetical protein [candidate division KSB1 bacterium]MCB9501119.1 hypothetical protein [Deferribacteres bacterium]